ncbi:MAG: TIGR04372 family glycosyltransferase [Rhodospirillales bacterium]|nr:TIGR04372 family glycosyltransferase [Rhodospirillales bacterium]
MTYLKAISRVVWRLLFVIAAYPLLWVMEPFVRIRLGYISNQRIGHLTINTEVFIRRNTVRGWPARTVYLFTTSDPANRQMLEMYKRRLNIYESALLSHIFFACRSLLQKTRFYQPITWSFADKTPETIATFNQPIETVSFTAEEEKRGQALLEEMGIGSDDWFACCHARDDAYLYNWRPHLADHWDITRIRNADIEDFRDAMEHITATRGFAVRVGAMVDKPFADNGNTRIIDYATKYRTDFGDIYLGAKSRFFLASNSGVVNIPLVFNKPVAMANLIPLSAVVYRSYDLCIPQTVVRTDTGEQVPYPSLVELGLFERERASDTEDILKANGLSTVKNTPEDIRALCDDMMRKLDGEQPSAEARELQLEFQRRCHNYYGVDTGLGFVAPSFALKYKHLITDDAAPISASRSA